MTGYWKNQRQYEGAVKVSAASMGGPGAGKVPGLPDVSGGSSQDRQDDLCLCEERVCRCTAAQRAYLEACIESGRDDAAAAGGVSDRPSRIGVPSSATRLYGGSDGAAVSPVSLSLDGTERTYSGAYGVEKYERKCLHCGEWFELLAQPDEDRRLFCSRGCYACPPDYREEA